MKKIKTVAEVDAEIAALKAQREAIIEGEKSATRKKLIDIAERAGFFNQPVIDWPEVVTAVNALVSKKRGAGDGEASAKGKEKVA